MSIPRYLYDGLKDKTVIFSYVNSGSYSTGFYMDFIRNKPDDIPDTLFLKLIPLCDDKDYEQFVRINFQRRIHTSSRKMFDNEISVQTHIYDNRKYNSCACIPIQDYFILDDGQRFGENTSDIVFFLKSLKMMEVTDVLDVNMTLKSIMSFDNNSLQLAVIIMPHINGGTGYNLYRSLLSKSKDFGSYFDSTALITEILEKKIRTHHLFCMVQIMYRIKELFKMMCIHDDLHLGNILINNDEICTSQAYFPNGNINPIFVGRVYLIDYGHAYISDKFKFIRTRYMKELLKKDHTFVFDSNNFYQIVDLIGRKILRDGYNKYTNAMTSDWYMYDWYFNLFFDKNMNVNKPVVKQMEKFVKEFEHGLMTYENEIEKTTDSVSVCCPFFV